MAVKGQQTTGVTWASVVGTRAVNSFHTINGNSYAYKNNVTLNTGPAINVVGNPASFLSGTNPYTNNINDGRTRNATRMFIYQALRAESDYTDAQAAAYGNSTADEFLILRIDARTGGALTGASPWPVHSSITGGSQIPALSTSTKALRVVAIKDRQNNIRAWRLKESIVSAPSSGTLHTAANTASAAFNTAYDKLTDAEINALFGLGTAPQAGYVYGNDVILAGNGTVLGDVDIHARDGFTDGTNNSPNSLGVENGSLTGVTRTGTGGSTRYTFASSLSASLWVKAIATWTHNAVSRTAEHFFRVYTTRGGGAYEYTIPDQSLSLATGAAGTFTVPQVSNERNPAEYSLSIAPAGFSISGRTVTVAGSVAAGTYQIVVRGRRSFATNLNRYAEALVNVTVIRTSAADAVAGSFNAGNQSVTLTDNTAGSQSFNAASGGTGTISYSTRYVLDPDDENETGITIGTGASLNIAASVGRGVYTIGLRATWTSGSTTATADSEITLTITRQAATPTASAGSLSIANKTASAQGTATDTVTVEAATGGTGTVSYSLVSPPAGYTMSGRVITIAGTAPSRTGNLTVRATWTSGSTTATTDATFQLAFTRTPNAAAGSLNINDKAITLTPGASGTVTLEAATGGTGTVVYALVGPPTGLSLHTTSRVLTIGSSYPAGSRNVTVRATWTSGSTTAATTDVFALTVTRQAATPTAVAGSFNPGNVTISGAPNTQLTGTFNAATGGTGTISYALLINGGATISVTGTTITVGATQAAGTFRIAVRARWTSGSTTADNTQFFNLTITRIATPTASAGTFSPSDVTGELRVNRAGSLTFGAATGGVGTITYAIVSDGGSGATISNAATPALRIPAATIAGAYRVAVRARWTSGSTSADRTAFFNIEFTRVMAAEDVPRAMGQRTIQWLAENDLRQDHNREIEYGSKK